jgi:hypothetical protein
MTGSDPGCGERRCQEPSFEWFGNAQACQPLQLRNIYTRARAFPQITIRRINELRFGRLCADNLPYTKILWIRLPSYACGGSRLLLNDDSQMARNGIEPGLENANPQHEPVDGRTPLCAVGREQLSSIGDALGRIRSRMQSNAVGVPSSRRAAATLFA